MSSRKEQTLDKQQLGDSDRAQTLTIDATSFFPVEEWGLLGRTVMELSGRMGMCDIFSWLIIRYVHHYQNSFQNTFKICVFFNCP